MELNGVMSMLPLATAGKVMVLYLSFFYICVYMCVCVYYHVMMKHMFTLLFFTCPCLKRIHTCFQTENQILMFAVLLIWLCICK